MATPADDNPGIAFADSWNQSGSLHALRECTEVGGRVRGVVARQAGLSESEIIALEHLVRGPLGPAELSRLLDVTTAAATGIVDRLVGHGHVTRAPHAEDRRRTQVLVTDAGREQVLRTLLPMFRALRELDESFDAQEREVVERYLRGAIDAFRQVTEPGPSSGVPETGSP